MREERKYPKSSWPKVVMRKWLNMRSGRDEFHSDYRKNAAFQRRMKSSADDGAYVVVPEELSDQWLMKTSNEIERPGLGQTADLATSSLRMFVGTWNVGGKSPGNELNLRDWLRSKAPADIYVLGFQEIVPLNAGNVLGAEDWGPAAEWLSLIRQALNDENPCPKPTHSFMDLLLLGDEYIEHNGCQTCPNSSSPGEEGSPSPPDYGKQSSGGQRKYSLAASKQMVGIFLCVWVREDLYPRITSLKVACVGRGIMRYLGNKGSISISMTLHETTLCFVCTHLASGEKGSDAVRRNMDVMEILKRTRFSHRCRIRRRPGRPDGILDHDKIIWLGDLNYRLAASCAETYELVERNDWQALLEKDKLRIEQKAGRVFEGWEEGEIHFPPTYKYIHNSDRYVVQTSDPKEKRRTPAWCDRILWKGEGLKQMCYGRGESRFSDHRPVYSLFSVQVNSPKPTRRSSRKPSAAPEPDLVSEPPDLSSPSKSTPGFLVNRTQSCMDLRHMTHSYL